MISFDAMEKTKNRQNSSKKTNKRVGNKINLIP